MSEIEFRTPITWQEYCEDYIKFGSRNRVVAVTSLMHDWSERSFDDQILLGGKILHEYAAAGEELFVYAYAAHKQCNIMNGCRPTIRLNF